MERARMPVPDGFLPGRRPVDLLQRQRHLDQLLAGHAHAASSASTSSVAFFSPVTFWISLQTSFSRQSRKPSKLSFSMGEDSPVGRRCDASKRSKVLLRLALISAMYCEGGLAFML